MSENSAASLLAKSRVALLDFDGPVCSVFSGYSPEAVSAELHTRLGNILDGMPETSEPFDFLEYAASASRDAAEITETELTRLEVAAVVSASATPGSADLLQALNASGRQTVIVSNNSAASVCDYLERHNLRRYVTGISARVDANPVLLKPNPHLIWQAIKGCSANPEDCIMVGDSISDIKSARAAGVPVIGFANKPGKRERFAPYYPDAVVDGIEELTGAGIIAQR